MKSVRKNSTLRKIFLSLFLSCTVLLSTCDDSPNQPPYELKEPDINLSGIWLLSGPERVTTYSEWPIPPGEEPVVEKYPQGFSVLLQQKDENKIRIFGLVGADAGRAENAAFPGCRNPENCEVFGIKVGDRIWEVDIQNGQRTYFATIEVEILINETEITLEGRYEHQNKTIVHEMDGEFLKDINH